MYPQKGETLSNRYHLEELLGEGAMGRVYRARDARTGEHVAVKLRKAGLADDPVLTRRFEREIETLRRLAHPNILGYKDHGRHGDTDYLVVELLVGRPLSDHRGDFLGDAERVMLLGQRLARAFATAHAAGVIHRDIKPGNIHVEESGEPRVLDYGLARWVTPEGETRMSVDGLTRSDAIMGTVPYMSPEQLRAERVDRRSDLFSLAVVLYELATGRRPYVGGSVSELYREIEQGRPPEMASLQPRLASPAGQALEACLRRALHPSAAQRMQSMEELASAFDAALDLESTLPPDASIAILLPPRLVRSSRHAVSLRGREQHLDRFAETLSALREGQGALVGIEGPTGMGRSLLADELLRMAHVDGCLCLAATLRPRGAEDAEHPAAAWLRRAAEVFPDDAVVGRAAALFDDAPAAAGGEAAGAVQRRGQRIFGALTALASRMPLALFLEDLHHADAALLRLIQRIAASAPGVGFALVTTRRTDFAADEAAQEWLDQIRALPGWDLHELEPLDRAAIRELVRDAYPGVTLEGPLLEELVERSEGNPAFVHSILRLLEERGALQRVGVDWQLGGDTVIPEVPEARSVVDARLATIEDQDRELLAAAAVLGTRFGRQRLRALLGWEETRLDARLEWLDRRRHLLIAVDGGFRFDQRITREVVLARLDEGRRRELHGRAAETLAAQLDDGSSPLRVGAVAEHFLAAGRKVEAMPLILRTAAGLKRRNAPDDALPWLRRGLAVIEQALEAGTVSRDDLHVMRAELELELGEMLFAVARHKEALEHLERARGLAADCGRDDLEARSLLFLSRDYMARGDLLQSERRARDAIRLSRRAKLDTEHALAMSMEAQALSRSGELENAEELWTAAAEMLDEQGRTGEAAEVRFRLGNQYQRTERVADAEATYRRALEGVDPEADPRMHARILNALGGVKMMVGAMGDAVDFLQRALEIRRRIGARRGVATTLHNLAYCRHMTGELERAAEESEQVIRLRREMGDAAGAASAERNHAEALHDLGRIEPALEGARRALAGKRELEDLAYIPSCLLLVGECELTVGRAAKAGDAFREVLRDHGGTHGKALLADFGMLLAERLGAAPDAAGLADRAAALAVRFAPGGIGFSDNQGIYGWCLRLMREGGRDAAALRRAADVLGVKFAAPYPPQTGISRCLGEAEIAIAEGNVPAARGLREEAWRIAQGSGFGEWAWRAAAARAEQGDVEAAQWIRRAARAIRDLSVRIRDGELRSAYLAHRDRAAVLERDAALPEETLEATLHDPVAETSAESEETVQLPEAPGDDEETLLDP